MGSHTLIFCVIFDVYKWQSILRGERYGFTIISVPNDLHDSIIKQNKTPSNYPWHFCCKYHNTKNKIFILNYFITT